MATFFANPYDLEATGFYFSEQDEFDEKYSKNLNRFGQPVEEYSIEFIDGTPAEMELYEALSDGEYINIDEYYDILNSLDESTLIAMIFLINQFGYEKDEALAAAEDVYLYEGRAKDWIEEHVEDNYSPEYFPESYIDYAALGRDFSINYPDLRDIGDDQEIGEYVYEEILGELLENLENAEYYYDTDALLRDMMIEGSVQEFDFGGKTYVAHGLLGVRNNPHPSTKQVAIQGYGKDAGTLYFFVNEKKVSMNDFLKSKLPEISDDYLKSEILKALKEKARGSLSFGELFELNSVPDDLEKKLKWFQSKGIKVSKAGIKAVD